MLEEQQMSVPHNGKRVRLFRWWGERCAGDAGYSHLHVHVPLIDSHTQWISGQSFLETSGTHKSTCTHTLYMHVYMHRYLQFHRWVLPTHAYHGYPQEHSHQV